jgi:sulfide:quinone oxidoreductase
VPVAPDGFIRTDLHCRVEGLDDVYAAGDATWFPVKQGGIAAQQADVAAAAIAAQAGAPVASRPFRPSLRGALLTGTGVRYLRHHPQRAEIGPTAKALWWPPAKIAGRYLGPYLAEAPDGAQLEDVGAAVAGAEEGMIAMALEAADADAGWGDFSSALRWLQVAERLALVLPGPYAEKRDLWHEAQAAAA